MNRLTQILSILLLFAGYTNAAPCSAGEDSVYIEVTTANKGYEAYWQLVPNTNSCGSGTLFEGGNTAQMNCNSANTGVATAGNGYASFSTITEGPWCLNTNSTYTIQFLDASGASDVHFTVKIKGQPVYIFHALNNTETFTFTVTPPLAFNVGVKKITTTSYVTTNPVSISGKIFNYSYNTIQSLDVHYSINNGTVYTDHVSGLNFGPYTDIDFIHSTLWTPPSNDAYSVKVWVDNIDGNADMDHSNDTLYRVVTTGSPVPNIVSQYLNGSPVFTLIADENDLLDRPSDLDFHTILSRNELWVINYSDVVTHGSTVTFYNAGTPNQVGLWRQDSNADHFMLLPTALAFADNMNFANSSGILDAHMGSGHYAGPILWSSDSLVYCQPAPGPLGSHIDMLHQSPYSMGIAADKENAFWVYDGYNQCVTWYDFVDDHGPGFDFHEDGLVRRYLDFTLSMLSDSIPSHLVMDDNGQLYIVDNGNARVVRMDTQTGTVTGTFTPYVEWITEKSTITGTTWNNYIRTGLVQPSGIDVVGNRLIVSDYSNGDIIIYDNSGSTGIELGRIHTGDPGITGVKVGPDGKIWYTNMLTNKVFRVDGIVTDLNEEQSVKAFAAYPNPSNKFLNVRLDNFKADINYNLMLSDVSGKSIFSSEINQKELQIKTSELSAGVYILSVSDGTSVFKEKVIITK